MRLLLVGIICLFCGAAFAEEATTPAGNENTTITMQQVPNTTYVDSMSNSVSVGRPSGGAPAGRALVWIEE